MKIRLIVNPRAGAGAAGRKAQEVVEALRRGGYECELAPTRAPGHATALAREARADKVDVIGIMGGDGTVNEVSQAYLDDQGDAVVGPDLALLSAGTGGDFRKTFNLPADPLVAVSRLKIAQRRAIDLGVLELIDDRGERVRRAFLNIASFGMGGRIDKIVNDGPKWIGGRAAFFLATLRAMTVYRNAPVKIRVDGEDWLETRVVNVAIANGQYFGGGMHVAPKADPSDGLFDVVCLGDLKTAESLALTKKIYAGTHLGMPKISMTRGRRVEAAALTADPVLVDLDGEAPGRLPIVARVAPSAITILA